MSFKTDRRTAILSIKAVFSRPVVAPLLLLRYVHTLVSCRKAQAHLRQVTAAIIALLNDARLRAGKPALGFLNPWIYSSGYKGFTDITAGQSDGCNGQNTQTGSAVNGVSHATTLWSSSATDLGIVWCYPGCALERYSWVGSSDWIWYAELRCSEGGCVQLYSLDNISLLRIKYTPLLVRNDPAELFLLCPLSNNYLNVLAYTSATWS